MAKRGENIYKRKDGRWEARIIKGHSEEGKALYVYFYGNTYEEVKSKIFAPVLLSYAADDSINIPCFGIIWDLCLERKKSGLKKSSYAKYSGIINNHIKPFFGNCISTNITGATIRSYISKNYKRSKCNASGSISEKTLKNIVTIIKSVLQFAKEEGWISDVPNINASFSRNKSKEIRILPEKEQRSLEKYLCVDMNMSKLGILLCLYTGLRLGEICALKWRSISLDNGTLAVTGTMQRVQTFNPGAPKKTEVIVTAPKSGNSLRVIPIPDILTDKLKMFQPEDEDAWFLTGKVGNYIEPRAYHNHFKAYITASGVEDVNFHALRHTFATRCVELGFDIKSLSEILGHSNVNITLNLYVHPSFDMKRSNMDKLEALY